MSNHQHIWKRERLKKIIQERRINRAYLSALITIISRFTRSSVPNAKQIRKILMAKAGRTTVSVYKFAIIDSLQTVERSYGRKLPILEKRGIEIIKEITAADLAGLGLATDAELIEAIGMVKVSTVSKKYHALLKTTHAKMLEQGASVGNIAEAFKEAVIELKRKAAFIAKRIAKTETTRIYSAGTLEGYLKSNVVRGKEWITNTGGNPRGGGDSEFDHLGADGEVVPVDKPFVNTGEELMYPGDPSGSAGNVINCECSITPKIRIAA